MGFLSKCQGGPSLKRKKFQLQKNALPASIYISGRQERTNKPSFILHLHTQIPHFKWLQLMMAQSLKMFFPPAPSKPPSHNGADHSGSWELEEKRFPPKVGPEYHSSSVDKY